MFVKFEKYIAKEDDYKEQCKKDNTVKTKKAHESRHKRKDDNLNRNDEKQMPGAPTKNYTNLKELSPIIMSHADLYNKIKGDRSL